MCSHALSAQAIQYDPRHASRRPEQKFEPAACRQHTTCPRWASGTDYPPQAGVFSWNSRKRSAACFVALQRTSSKLQFSCTMYLACIALHHAWLLINFNVDLSPSPQITTLCLTKLFLEIDFFQKCSIGVRLT
jgi:hypothetical protein